MIIVNRVADGFDTGKITNAMTVLIKVPLAKWESGQVSLGA